MYSCKAHSIHHELRGARCVQRARTPAQPFLATVLSNAAASLCTNESLCTAHTCACVWNVRPRCGRRSRTVRPWLTSLASPSETIRHARHPEVDSTLKVDFTQHRPALLLAAYETSHACAWGAHWSARGDRRMAAGSRAAPSEGECAYFFERLRKSRHTRSMRST